MLYEFTQLSSLKQWPPTQHSATLADAATDLEAVPAPKVFDSTYCLLMGQRHKVLHNSLIQFASDATRAPDLTARAPGLTTRNKKLLGAPGIATRSKDATRG